MKKLCLMIFVTIFIGVFVTVPVPADIKLPAIFASNMVLQRDSDISIFGWADPDEVVTVSCDGRSVSAKSGTDGTWRVTLEPFEVGSPLKMIVEGNNTIILDNILVGDVWLCSGQSNMEMKVMHCNDSAEEIAAAYHPSIRFFSIRNALSTEPIEDCVGKWDISRPSTVGEFSASAYYFGRKINSELKVPVGLIHASWGGSAIETWMSKSAFESNPELQPIIKYWEPVFAGYASEVVTYYNAMGDWLEDAYHAMFVHTSLKSYVEPPDCPVELGLFPIMPFWTYNAMVAPLKDFPIKGVIWYQGETNAVRAHQYRTLLPALIKDWRGVWGDTDLPFIFAQIANWETDSIPIPGGWGSWPELREAQLMTLSIPYTGMAVTIDIGESEDIHPRNKQEVGRRLALSAMKVAYGMDVVHSGPIFKAMSVIDGKAHIKFRYTESGLKTKDGQQLQGFSIAGVNRQFTKAQAEINNNEVVVWSSEISEPVAVRYGWDDDPVCTLINGAGLPASPFRTDTWSGITEGKLVP